MKTTIMKKCFTSLSLAVMIAAAVLPVYARQPQSELTKAMLKAYEQTLQEDPGDYLTLYRRAVEYFRIGDNTRAMNDLEEAMKLTPGKDGDLLSHEYSLLADLTAREGDYQKSLAAINNALAINSDSYADIYKKGNIQLALNDSEGALRTFQSMQRLKSRSPEAFFGMARAYVQKGNMEEANRMIDEMKNIDSTSALTYSRIGELMHEMGDDEKSVVNYLAAISMGGELQRSITALEDIASTNYGGFCRGFDFAQSQSNDARSLSYIRGSIAANTNHFQDAYDILTSLQTPGVEQSVSSLARLAKVCLSLGKTAEARRYADAALSSDGGNADAYLVKSAAELIGGNSASALLFAGKAYDPADPDEESMIAIARAAISRGDASRALEALNEAILLDGDAVAPLLLRAYVKQYMMNDVAAANADLERAGDAEVTAFPQVAYKALGQTLAGRLLDGEATMEKALAANQSPEALVYAAIYYTQTGASDKGMSLLEKAKDAGYDNVYLMEQDTTPYLSFSTKK